MKHFFENLLLALVVLPIMYVMIVTPMTAEHQFVFGLCMIASCFVLSNLSSKHMVSVILILVSVTMSTRYMYFRLTQTLVFTSLVEAVCGYILFLAEFYVYIILLLSSFQISWALKRDVVPMPRDISKWPTVDVYIPTYNESLSIVRDTVLAAQCLEYPQDKIKVYLLDDGRRKEFAQFATEAGVGYITRSDNAHAKAGNLNHAMKLTHGELIAIFDCDHIATRMFLQDTVGAFLTDPKLALIQTPHHFYSPDPIQRNLYLGRDIPAENELFYGPVQRGNDNWDAAFFCGSCAVIRRKALDEIGGFAVETVTEDAHTALRLQRRGWKTAYLNKILAAGLATERTILHIIQRNRWARGMIQILRLDNPLFGRGLTFAQRLCYLSATMYFLFALPRVVFLVIPSLYLIFGISVLHGSAAILLAYALPHLFMSYYTSSRVNGRSRYSFWGEIYDILLSFPLVIPTLAVLISPRHGKFNVTDKGGTIDKAYFDAHAVRAHIICAIFLTFSIAFGIAKYFMPQYFNVQLSAVLLNIGWAVFNLTLLTAAICVARETPNKRKAQRLEMDIPVLIYQESGICSRSTMRDISMTGCRIDNVLGDMMLAEDPVTDLELATDHGPVNLRVNMIGNSAFSDYLRFDFGEVDINTRRELVRLMFTRPDTWARKPYKQDNIIVSYFTVLACIWDSLTSNRKQRRKNKNKEKPAETVEDAVKKDASEGIA